VKKFILLLLLTLLAYASVPETTVACRVDCQNSYGSGIVLDNGFVLTAAHVVSHQKNGHTTVVPFPRITFDDNTRKTGRLERFNKKIDLALFQTGHKLRGVSLGETPTKGDPIWVIGCSGGFKNSIKLGIVSNVTDTDLLTDATVSPGDSGGAMLNDSGELVGLTQAVMMSRGTIYVYGVGVPIATIKEFLKGI